YTNCCSPSEHLKRCSTIFDWEGSHGSRPASRPDPAVRTPSPSAHEPTATSAGVRPHQPGEEADLPLPSITSTARSAPKQHAQAVQQHAQMIYSP
ncbi:hypothetical protein ACLOJK_027381, partial [Asimina triloba]